MSTKTIYTSYYGRNESHENAISISASAPKSFKGPHMTVLAPSWELLNGYKDGKITKAQYATKYIELLESRKLTPQIVYDSISNGSILLCYEKPGDFCHRRILAEWLEKNLNVMINEWVSEAEQKKSDLLDDVLDF